MKIPLFLALISIEMVVSGWFGTNGPAAEQQVPATTSRPSDKANPQSTIGLPELSFVDVSQFFCHASEKSSLRFTLVPIPPRQQRWKYEVHGYADNVVYGGEVESSGEGALVLPLELPQGFYELTFPELGKTFGVISLPKNVVTDDFFGLDTGLSTLSAISHISQASAASLQPSLIKDIRQMGLSASRERLSWGSINPQPDIWDWETENRYDTVRKLYVENGIKVLELFHGAPGWTHPTDNNSFPDDLIGTEKSWENIGSRWQSCWAGLEIWNEPDTAFGNNAPADRYLPLVKTIRYAFNRAGVTASIGGGVFAYLNKAYLDAAAGNGLLDESDFISFHYYDFPLGLEDHISRFRSWLKEFGHDSKPLWITEIGRPWEGSHTIRPSSAVQAMPALVIGMDTIEARACGVARIFPFIYTNYFEQQIKNFGMMDNEMTPLRSMAAYCTTENILGGAEYVGDLNLESPLLKRVRVFARRDDHDVVVLYTDASVPTSIEMPFPIVSALGIDGRTLHQEKPDLAPIPDGLTYLMVKKGSLDKLLIKDTTAARLFAMSREKVLPLHAPSPIVLQPLIDTTIAAPSSRAYNLPEKVGLFPLHLRINNLSGQNASVSLTVPTAEAVAATVPARSATVVSVNVDVTKLPLNKGGLSLLDIEATSPTVPKIDPVQIPFALSRGLQEYLASNSYQFALPIGELNRWSKNASGETAFLQNDTVPWEMKATFGGEERWAYPKFALPQEVELTKVDGILIRGRASPSAGSVKIMSWSQDAKQSYTEFSVIAPDGQWHAGYIPLNTYLEPINGNSHLGTQIKQFSVGFNPTGPEATLEISDLYFVGRSKSE